MQDSSLGEIPGKLSDPERSWADEHLDSARHRDQVWDVQVGSTDTGVRLLTILGKLLLSSVLFF